MSTPTPIDPYTQTTTKVITSFTVSCRSITLFTSASFTVDCFDAENNLINRQVLNMGTDEYLQWQNNDEFVITWVAQQLGFTIETPPVPVVEESSP